ncbi:MAG: pyridoxal-phosphate dependent enzyme [Steroidobacteraceae bacterium]
MRAVIGEVPHAAIEAARRRLGGLALGTRLLELAVPGSDCNIAIKLENEQPAGSFKLRPVANSLLSKERDTLASGVHTLSSGNSAVALAWMAARLGIPATAIVPGNAPPHKLRQLRELGAHIVTMHFDDWWQAILAGAAPGVQGLLVDAARDAAALAANGTIGLEIVESMDDLDAVFTPFGSGALACGIACAVRPLRPSVKIIACELDSAQPLTAAIAAGKPTTVEYDSGFVSGVGFSSILPELWPLASRLIDGTCTVSIDEVAAAIRLLSLQAQVTAEGAGAIAVAAALSRRHPYRKVCAVVSGGNIERAVLVRILAGAPPAK